MIRSLLLFIGFFLYAQVSQACVCGANELTWQYQKSDFVAEIKILSVAPDPESDEQHNVTYELINLFKGVAGTKLKASTSLNTSCAFMPELNSRWFVFVSEYKGTFAFHYCNSKMFGPLNKRDIDVTRDILKFLADNKITTPNPFRLVLLSEGVNKIRGFKNENRFAAFKFTLHADRSLNRIQTLAKFKNPELQKAVLKALKTDVHIYGSRSAEQKITEVVLFCTYYEGSADNPSSVYTTVFL